MAEGIAQATKPVPGIAGRPQAARQAPGYAGVARRTFSEPGMAAERMAGARSPRSMIPSAGRVPVHEPRSLQRVSVRAIGGSAAPGAASVTVQRCGGHPCPSGGCDVPVLQELRSSHDAHDLKTVENPAAVRGGTASSLVREVLASPGSGLDKPTQALMEARFGHDFGAVRIHTGSRANDSAYAMGARAYTVGDHIVFSGGSYAPGTYAGKITLAHELTHVIQQRQASVDGTAIGGGLRISHPSDRFEREADRVARQVAGPSGNGDARPRRTSGTTTSLAVDSASVQRQPWWVVVAGPGAILLWAKHCLSPLEKPMKDETFVKFLPAYHRDMRRPIHNRVWDAFGHCWIACAGTKKCGRMATAIAGKSREFYREYIGGGPHDSYEQDTHNQTIGRGYGSLGLDCFTMCDAAVRDRLLDLSAPEGTCYDGGKEYLAPCEPGGPRPGSSATAAAPSSAASATGAGPADAGTSGPSDDGPTIQRACDCGSVAKCPHLPR